MSWLITPNECNMNIFKRVFTVTKSQCALCGTTTMVTFIVVPLVAGFCTLVFSKIDIAIRGQRAREPIFKVTQPEECNNFHINKQETLKQVDDPQDESEEFDADAEEEEKGASNNLKVDQPDRAAEEAQHPQVAA